MPHLVRAYRDQAQYLCRSGVVLLDTQTSGCYHTGPERGTIRSGIPAAARKRRYLNLCMEKLTISVSSADAADAMTDAGLTCTTYLSHLRDSLYAEVRTVEQPRAFGKGAGLFIAASWCFRKTNETQTDIGFRAGREFLSRVWGRTYDRVEVSVTVGAETHAVAEYASNKKIRTYRIGDHNEVYSDVEEQVEGEHYVTYHRVSLDAEDDLELVCALHFEVLSGELPAAGRFYFANWWFELDTEPVPDSVGLPRIGCEQLSEVTIIVDGLAGEIRYEQV